MIDRSVDRLRQLDDMFMGRVRTLYSTASVIETELETADAVIGAALIPGANAPKLVTRRMLRNMKQGAVSDWFSSPPR